MPKNINLDVLRLSFSIVLIVSGSNFLLEPVEAMPQMMKDMMSSKFNSADKNADRELTLTEAKDGGLPTKILEKFDIIDANKSGTISLEEMFTAFDSGAIKR
ncbi:MAG: hypothetical protein WCD18_25365 [Thermosynechococcaceae cyanobacterium]